MVIFAGRGHERTQTVDGRMLVLDDATEARRALLHRMQERRLTGEGPWSIREGRGG